MHFGVIHFKSCKENYQSAQVPSLGPQVWVSADQIKLPGRFYFGRWVTRKRTPSSGFFFFGAKTAHRTGSRAAERHAGTERRS